VESDWDWCQQCGYDPEGLRPERVEVGAIAGRSAPADKETRSRRTRHKKKATVVAAVPAAPVDPRPRPPRQPTDTVYGLLPYDDPSSVSPVEPDPPDNSELINRRFAIVALCVIFVGLALLVTALLVG
jgi:hypothetical protein